MFFDSDWNQLNEAASDVLFVSILESKACILSSLESNDSFTGSFAIRVLSNLNGVFNHTKAVEELIDIVISHRVGQSNHLQCCLCSGSISVFLALRKRLND